MSLNNTNDQLSKFGLDGLLFMFDLPDAMELRSEFESERIDLCSYVIIGMEPWAGNSMMELRDKKTIIVKVFSEKQYESMLESDGMAIFPEAYAGTISEFHENMKVYRIPGQYKSALRYDLKVGNYFVCLSGIAWTPEENTSMAECLSFFPPIFESLKVQEAEGNAKGN